MTSVAIVARRLLFGGVLLGAILGSPVSAQLDDSNVDEWDPKLFILSFNRWGDSSNPAEIDLMKRELASDPEHRAHHHLQLRLGQRR